jgi:hypothetical protein
MGVIFLLLAVLAGVVLVDVVMENTGAATVTLFNRSFDQLTWGELLLVAAGVGFLLLLFLMLAFGSSRARRMRRRERRVATRDLEGQVEELERENARMRQELSQRRPAAPVDRSGATAASARQGPPPPPGGPEPLRSRRERLDDRTTEP